MDSFLEFLNAVNRATKDRRLDWEALGDESFQTQVQDAILVINHRVVWNDEDSSSTESFQAWVSNRRGQTVESQTFLEGTPEYILLNGIYEAARRNALKSDDFFKSLTRSLQPAGAA